MFSQWFGASLGPLILTILKTTGIYIAVIAFTRMFGLRSFAKISGFDFAMTVAVGSALATTMLSPDPPLVRAAAAIFTLYCLQKLVSRLRRSTRTNRYIDNQPLMIVEDGEILPDALDRADLTEQDLRAKLRQQSITRLGDVRAVVLEMTGDVSVIAVEESDRQRFDDWILEGVQRAAEIDNYETDDARREGPPP